MVDCTSERPALAMATAIYRPTVCPSCGKDFKRTTRKQVYCSARCKEKDRGQKRTRKAGLGGDTGAPAIVPAKPLKALDLHGVESASDAPVLQVRRPLPRKAEQRLQAAARSAVVRLAWPGWSEADYAKALQGAKAWVVDRPPAGAARKTREGTSITRPVDLLGVRYA